MGQTSTGWVITDMRARRARRQRTDTLLVAALLCVMATAEVVFLNFVGGSDTIASMMAAEGAAPTE